MKDLPSWLQAGAAIVALVISVTALWRPEAASRRRDKVRAKSIIMAITPELSEIAARIDQVERFVRQDSNPASPMRFVLGEDLEEFEIGIPPLLSRNIDRLHWLGEPTGPTILRLLSAIYAFNMMLKAEMERTRAPPGHSLAEHLHTLREAINDSRKQVEEIH